MRRILLVACTTVSSLVLGAGALAQEPAHPAVEVVDVPSVKVLRGLTVLAFEAEMQFMNQALGVSCGHCHARNNIASEDNPRKGTARRMLEMARAIIRAPNLLA